VRERGVSVAQVSRDFDVHENVVRKWVKEFGADPKQAFPGHGCRREAPRRSREAQRCSLSRFHGNHSGLAESGLSRQRDDLGQRDGLGQPGGLPQMRRPLWRSREEPQ
jgi:hypothetical protein